MVSYHFEKFWSKIYVFLSLLVVRHLGLKFLLFNSNTVQQIIIQYTGVLSQLCTVQGFSKIKSEFFEIRKKQVLKRASLTCST